MPYPSSTLYPSSATYPGFPPSAPTTANVPTPLGRVEIPLRLSVDIETPSGRHYRWGADEPNPANAPSGIRFSSTMPGGFESLDITLARKPGVDYSDLERLSTLTVLGPGGEVAGEYRLERAPRASGDQLSISPGAVGWQASLDDDRSARMIYVDRDLSNWTGPGRARQIDMLSTSGAFIRVDGPDVKSDSVNPALRLNNQGKATAGDRLDAEAWYDAGASVTISQLYHDFETKNANDANHRFHIGTCDDDIATNADESADLFDASPDTPDYYTPTAAYRYGRIRWRTESDVANDNTDRIVAVRKLTVYGDHGLTLQGDDPQGVYASDVVSHAVGRWAPLLNVGEIASTGFVIPHLVFADTTTAAEIIRQANRFHLYDWAVWEDRAFYFHERGARGRSWRARVAPAQLEETGPQVERLWNGVIVRYTAPDGSSRTVGPVGSGADTETSDVEDSDPLNPANVLGIRRWDVLDMGVTSTADGATQVGTRFISESKLLDSSGRATLVGVVEDDRGVTRPAWQVRAGDTITFVDASDTSARRIVRADYDHDARTCSVDIDSPPEGLDALLERLGVVLIPLGIS